MSTPLSKPLTAHAYRADIDGLRAIAVLAVIVFHIHKGLLPGGFAGVDIFFVISGFLITQHMLQELDAGVFSLTEFYRRRIKRIAPAMLVVTAATMAAAMLLLLPEDAAKAGKSAIWSLASAANVYFWLFHDGSYFAASSEQQPLLHLWSLGVEEQFYLLWPLLLMALYRPARFRPVAAALLALAACSFAFGSAYFERDPQFVYYMLPARAGELLAGALAAFFVRQSFAGAAVAYNPVASKSVAGEGLAGKISGSLPADGAAARLAAPAAALGLALVAGSLAWLSEDRVFPGWWALPPTLGATLLIVVGSLAPNRVGRLLAWRPLVWTGRLSYSAYLWHWPLLAFYRYGYGEVGPVAGTVLFALTFALAWLTWRWVEQPMRKLAWAAVRVFLLQWLLPASAVGALCLWSVYGDRLQPARLDTPYRRQLAALRDQTRPAYTFDYVCQRQHIAAADAADPRCVLGPPDARSRRILLWGDSNAAHYVGMLGRFAEQGGFRFRNIAVGACPPLLADPTPFVDAGRTADCRASLAAIRPLLDDARTVIISATWTSYQERSGAFLPAFFDTVNALTAQGKTVILLGKVPVIRQFDRLCREKALRYPELACTGLEQALSADVANTNAALRAFAAGKPQVRYFDATAYLCPDGLCSPYGGGAAARYYDPSHLTMSGSWTLGSAILAAGGVPAVFRFQPD